MSTRRCLIVGAGSSGLAAVQQALAAGLDPLCVDANPGVGGAWRYDPNPGTCDVRFDERGVATVSSPGESDDRGRPPPSPMYAGLRTNVPTALMQYRGRPFPSNIPLFCKHTDVQAYLESFAAPLLPHLRFNTRLVLLRHTLPSDADPSRRWYAELRSTLDPDAPVQTEQFDAVIVANGHYSKPYIPYTDGLSSFTGEILHSRWYRDAEALKNKTVLVIGNSASGYDITRELASSIWDRRQSGETTVPKIYQAARSPPALGIPFDSPDAPEYGKEVGLYPPIKRVEGKTVEFENGKTVDDVEVIMFATGYFFSFPFLPPTAAPFSSFPLTYAPPLPHAAPGSSETVSTTTPAPRGEPSRHGGLRVHNLDDRGLFYLPDPTLAFLGLPYLVIPFPLAQLQARLATLHFASSPRLPSPLIFTPDPLMRRDPSLPAGPGNEDDSAPETRASVVWGHPRQYDMHDRWLRECGDVRDGDGDGNGEGEGEGEEREKGGLTGERSIWGLTSEAERDLRKGAKGLRKAVLGY
ncbi:hypothetical protein JCM10207_004071 [Rhodosporidiobolus poonsookiae]